MPPAAAGLPRPPDVVHTRLGRRAARTDARVPRQVVAATAWPMDGRRLAGTDGRGTPRKAATSKRRPSPYQHRTP